MSWLGIQAKLYAFGAGAVALAALFLRLSFLRRKTERLEREADTLKARHQAETVKKKIKREEAKRLVSRRADLAAELNKEKEDFDGVKTFKDPNDF